MRRALAEVRHIEADPVFRSVLVSQLINKVLWKGKKQLARRVVYDALELVEKRAGQDPKVEGWGQRGADRDVGEMPQRVRDMEQGDDIAQ